MEDEFAKDTNDEFWEVILKKASEKLGREVPPKVTEMTSITVNDTNHENNLAVGMMTPEQKKKFLKQTIPWGKNSGKTVQTVFKKDKEALRKIAESPLPFQIQLRKFLASE
jgi:hypothetical protein